jgi:hypothetical protein
MAFNPDLATADIWKIQSLTTQGEVNRQKAQVSWPHSQPGSTYVAVIGAMYDPGVWEKLVNMTMYTTQQGLKCWMEEIWPARASVIPMVDVAGMRDLAVRRALDGGFEFVLLVDSDTLPEMDLLLKLLAHEAPIVAPFIAEPGVSRMLGDPPLQLNTGLQRARWICASFTLFRTSVFNCPGVSFKAGDIGDDLFWRNLWHFGHRPYVDTNESLKLTRGPGRPGALKWKQRWERLEKMYNRSTEKHDRMPIDPNSPHIHEGVYAPFIIGSQNGSSNKV